MNEQREGTVKECYPKFKTMHNQLKPFWKITSHDQLLDLIVQVIALEQEDIGGYLEWADEIKDALRDAAISVTPYYFSDGHLITISWNKNNLNYPVLQDKNKFKVTYDGETSLVA